VGALLNRVRRVDLTTLTDLNFYVFVPALVFVKMLDADLAAGPLVTVGLFSAVHALLLLALAWAVFSRGALAHVRTAGGLCVVFFNAGNYGIPLTILAFGDRQVSVIAVVMIVQNLLTFTLGIWLLERKGVHPLRALVQMMKVPTVDAILLALALRGLRAVPPAPLRQVIDYLGDGLIPIALLTLGVQLGRSRPARDLLPLATVTVLRLAASPLVAALLVLAFRFGPPVSAVLIASAGLPVAVNVYILTARYREHEEFASQAVFWTTLLSAVTISVLLMLVWHQPLPLPGP
jgi:predicted permease